MNPFFYFPRKIWDLERFSLGYKQTLVFPGISAWSRITAKDYIRHLLATNDKLVEIFSSSSCVNKKVRLFCTENGYTNVGKNVTHICWHPNVVYDTQILACLLTIDSKKSSKNDGILNILQIWDYGNLSNCHVNPVCKYSLILDWGKIIKMLWISADVVSKTNVKSCEYRNYNSESPQELYGHMLFVCADGSLKIIPVPKISDDEVNKFDFIESESAAPHMVVLEINHANIMNLGISTSYINDTKTRFGYPTCVDWKSKFSSMLLVGFSSGFVAIFDVSVAHHTRYDYTNNYLAPVYKKRVSYSSVIAVSFSPVDWKQFNVTVAPNLEGSTNFNVNVASNFGPIDILMSDKPLWTVIWPNRADLLIAVPSTKNKIIIKSILSDDKVEVHINKITSISVCDLLNSIIVTTECGSLLSIDISNPLVVKALIESNNSIDVTSVPSHIRSYRYNVDNNIKGENFKAFIDIKSKADLVPLYDIHKKIEYPTICSMSVNPNMTALGYVAVAFDNGIINLSRFSERDISPKIESLFKCNIRPETSIPTQVTKITKVDNIKTIKVVPVTFEKKRSKKLSKVKDTSEYDPLDQILNQISFSSSPSDSKSNSAVSGRKASQLKKNTDKKTKRKSKRPKFKIVDTESDNFSNISDTLNFSDPVVFQFSEDKELLDVNSCDSGATERMIDPCTDYDLVHEDFEIFKSSYSQPHPIDEEINSKISDSTDQKILKNTVYNFESEKKINLEHDKELGNSEFIQKSNIGVGNIEKSDESSFNDGYITDNVEVQEATVYSDMSIASDNYFSMDSEENKCVINYDLNTSDKIIKSVAANVNLDFVQDLSNSTVEVIAKESDKVMDLSVTNKNKTEMLLPSKEINEINLNLDMVLDSINTDKNEIETVEKIPRIKLVSYSLSTDSDNDKGDINSMSIVSTDNFTENLNISYMKPEKFTEISKNEFETNINTINSVEFHECKKETIDTLIINDELNENVSSDVCSEQTEVNSSEKEKFVKENEILPLQNSDINRISNERIQIIFDDSDLNVEYSELDSISFEDTRSTLEVIDDNINRNTTKTINLLDNDLSLSSKNVCKTDEINVNNLKSDYEIQDEPVALEDNSIINEDNSIICAKNVDSEFLNSCGSLEKVENNLNSKKDKIISLNQDNKIVGEISNSYSTVEINPLSIGHCNLENQSFINKTSSLCSDEIVEKESGNESNYHIKIEQRGINLENNMVGGLLETESLKTSEISYTRKSFKGCLNNNDSININKENPTSNEEIYVNSSKLAESELSPISNKTVLLETIVKNKNDINVNNEEIIPKEENVTYNELLSVSPVICSTKSLDIFQLDSVNPNKHTDDISLNYESEITTVGNTPSVICKNDYESIEIIADNLKANKNQNFTKLEDCQKSFKFTNTRNEELIPVESSSSILHSETISADLKESPDDKFVEINPSKCGITSPLPTNIKLDFKIESVEINITNDESNLFDRNEIESNNKVKNDSETNLEIVENNFVDLDNQIINIESKNQESLRNSENEVVENNLEVEFIAVNYSKQKSNSISNVFQFLNKIQQTYQSTDEKDNIDLNCPKFNVNEDNKSNINTPKKQDDSTVLSKQTSPLNLKMNLNQKFSPIKESNCLEAIIDSDDIKTTIKSGNKNPESFTNNGNSVFIEENIEDKSKFIKVNLEIDEVESKFNQHDEIVKLISAEKFNIENTNESKSNIGLHFATNTLSIIEKTKISSISEIDTTGIHGIIELFIQDGTDRIDNTNSPNSNSAYNVDKSILNKQNIKKSLSEKLDNFTKISPKNETFNIDNFPESTVKNKISSMKSFNVCTGSTEGVSIKQKNLEDLSEIKRIENQSNFPNNQISKVIQKLDSDSFNNIEKSTVIFNNRQNIKESTYKILSNMPKILPKSEIPDKIQKINKLKEHNVAVESSINQEVNKLDSTNILEKNELIKSSLKNLIISNENCIEIGTNLIRLDNREQSIKVNTQQNVQILLPDITLKINLSDKQLNKTDLDQSKKVKTMNEKKTTRKRYTNDSLNDNIGISDDISQKLELHKSSAEENTKKRKLEHVLLEKYVAVVNKRSNNNKREVAKILLNRKKSTTECSTLPSKNPISEQGRVLKRTSHFQNDTEPVKKLKTINQYKSEISKCKEIDLDEKVSLEKNSGKEVNLLITKDKDEGEIKQKRKNKTESHLVNKESDLEKEISLKSKKRKLSSAENCEEKVKQTKVNEPVVNKRISARLKKQSDSLAPESSTMEIHTATKLEVKSNFSVSNSTNSEGSSSRKALSTGNPKNSKTSTKTWWHGSVISIEWLDKKYKGGRQTIKGVLLENEPIVNQETLVRWPKPTSKQYPAIVRQIYYGD